MPLLCSVHYLMGTVICICVIPRHGAAKVLSTCNNDISRYSHSHCHGISRYIRLRCHDTHRYFRWSRPRIQRKDLVRHASRASVCQLRPCDRRSPDKHRSAFVMAALPKRIFMAVFSM